MSLLLTLWMLAAAPPVAPAPPPSSPPMGEAAASCRAAYPLRRPDAVLTQRLERALRAADLGRALDKKRLGVSVVDLSDKTRIRYAGINDDEMFYVASLAKIAAVLAAAQAAKEKRIEWTPEVAHDAFLSISRSDNASASRLVRLTTVPYIEQVLRRDGYCFFGDEDGGLWLGRGFDGRGRTRRDPVEHTVHGGTSRQVARFFTMLDKDLLVGPVGSNRVRAAMRPPRLPGRVGRSIADTSDVDVVARKHGTWRTFYSDAALIQHGTHRYVVVVVSNLKQGGATLDRVFTEVDGLLVPAATAPEGGRSVVEEETPPRQRKETAPPVDAP